MRTHLVSKIMQKQGSEICAGNNSGHDRIIDGYKTEIKFSLSVKKDHFMFNHLACHKDWERLILLGINPNDHFQMNWMYKKDFVENIKYIDDINSDICVFKYQQGGKKTKNDDYIFSSNYSKLKNAKILQEMNTWMKDGSKKTGLLLWM